MPESQSSCSIAVDAMGGDLGPVEVVQGVALALKSLKTLSEVILVGNEAVLSPLVESAGLNGHQAISIHHASEVIDMDEKPIQSLRKKKDSSLVRMVELLKEERVGAGVSCGNTGSLMACGILRLRPMKGVERPAMPAVIPVHDHYFILIDAGANPTSTPENLIQNAILGSHYARVVLKKENPRVGLLTIGTEEGKGNERTHETHLLLKKIGGVIQYSGLIEGFQVFQNHVDVIVCDGFTGNVLVKTCESLFHSLKHFLSTELKRNPLRMLGAVLAGGAFKAVKNQLNPDRYGGAPFLGLQGTLLKAHGSSNRFAIMHTIRIATEIVTHDMNALCLRDIARANSIIKDNGSDQPSSD